MADRQELKGFFKRGEIPTEEQFGHLIDSSYNVEDGVDGPLKIGVGTDDLVPAINFFRGTDKIAGVEISKVSDSPSGLRRLKLSAEGTSLYIGGRASDFRIATGSPGNETIIFGIERLSGSSTSRVHINANVEITGTFSVGGINFNPNQSQVISLTFEFEKIDPQSNIEENWEIKRPVSFSLIGDKIRFYPINEPGSQRRGVIINLNPRNNSNIPNSVTIGIIGQFSVKTYDDDVFPPSWIRLGASTGNEQSFFIQF